MKRILYVLIGLCTLGGFQASANQSEGDGCSCDESNLVLGPITLVQTLINCSTYDIQVPPVTGCLDVELSHTYFFQILNPSGLPIHSESSTSPMIQYDFQFDTPGQYWIVVTYTMTDDSQCTHTLPPSVVPFNWLGCGNCSCDPSNLVLGQITMEQSTSDCSSYIINVPPVTGCESVVVSRNYNFRIYNSTGVLVYDVDEALDGTLFDFIYQPIGLYTIVVTYTMVDDSGCTHTIPSVQTTFDWTGCNNCSCDEDDLELGPITFIQSTSDCSSYVINVPPVLGCSDVTESRNYNFKVYNSNGFLVYNVDESLDGTLFDFGSYPPGMFTVVVTFNMKDDSGCEHELPPVTANFNWAGCLFKSLKQDLNDQPLVLKTVPNPAKNYVSITLTGVSDEFTLNQPEILLFDISGKEVYQSEITLDEAQEVDLSSFNSGVYFIKIVDDNTLLSTEKLIIE